MKTTFIAVLHRLEVGGDLGPGDKVSDTLRVTNNRDVRARLLPQSFRSIMGAMEVAAILNDPAVIYSEADLPDELTPLEYLRARLYEVQSFLMSTWVIEDNAINCEMGFLLYYKDGLPTVTSTFIAHLYSDSSGAFPHTRLSRERFREMRTLFRADAAGREHFFALPISQLTSSHPRPSRAFYFMNAARGAADVAFKITHYCTAFETLFSSSQQEVAHQLSERMACYLWTGVEDRLAAYRSIKNAYGLRSKIVHGSTIKDSKVADAQATAVYCDGVARQLMHRLLTEPDTRALFEQGPEAFDEAMLRTVLGT